MKRGILFIATGIIALSILTIFPFTARAWEGRLDIKPVPTQWDFYKAFEQDGTFTGVSPHARNEYDEPRSVIMVQEDLNGQTVTSIYAAKNLTETIAFGGEDTNNRNITFDFASSGVQRKSWREDGSAPTGFTFVSGTDSATEPNPTGIYFANTVQYFGDQESEFYDTYTYSPPQVPDPEPEPEPEEPTLLNTGYMDSNARIDTRFLDHVATTISILLTFVFAYQFRWRGRRE